MKLFSEQNSFHPDTWVHFIPLWWLPQCHASRNLNTMLSFAAHIEDWTRSKKKRNMLWTKQISSMEYRQDFRIWALTLIVNILPEIVLVHDMSRQMVLHFCYVQQTIILSKFLCHKKYYVYFETSFNCTQRRWYCTCMHIIPG